MTTYVDFITKRRIALCAMLGCREQGEIVYPALWPEEIHLCRRHFQEQCAEERAVKRKLKRLWAALARTVRRR